MYSPRAKVILYGYRIYDRASAKWDSGWTSLGGSLSSGPAAVTLSSGDVVVLAKGKSNNLKYTYIESKSLGTIHNWVNLGGTITSDPSAFVNSDNTIIAFALNTGYALYKIEFSVSSTLPESPDISPDDDWKSLGGKDLALGIGAVRSVTSTSDRAYVFALDASRVQMV